jgi:uncharacterized membrane protein
MTTTTTRSVYLASFLATNKVMYDDVNQGRPAFPGAPDTYRRREYKVDREVAATATAIASGGGGGGGGGGGEPPSWWRVGS